MARYGTIIGFYKVASTVKCDFSKIKGGRVIVMSLWEVWQLLLNYFLSNIQVLQEIAYLHTYFAGINILI